LTQFFSEAHILKTKHKDLKATHIEQKRLFTDGEKGCIDSLKNSNSFTESVLRDFQPNSFPRLHKATCDQFLLLSEQKKKTTEKLERLKCSLRDFDVQNKIIEAKMTDKSTDDTITDCLSEFDQPCRDFETEVTTLVGELNHFEGLVNQLDHCWLASVPGQLKLAEELVPRLASCASSTRYIPDIYEHRNHLSAITAFENETSRFEESVMDFLSKHQILRTDSGVRNAETHATRDHSTLMNRLKLHSQSEASTNNSSRNILLSKLEKYKD
jgi:hypothetical protein